MKGNRSMQDMTEGRPISLILKFFFPLLFGMLFQQFYNLVDTAIVGKFLGPDDLAAVGATGSVNFLILGFCMGVCNGFSIPVAQKFGAKDESGLRLYFVPPNFNLDGHPGKYFRRFLPLYLCDIFRNPCHLLI